MEITWPPNKNTRKKSESKNIPLYVVKKVVVVLDEGIEIGIELGRNTVKLMQNAEQFA